MIDYEKMNIQLVNAAKAESLEKVYQDMIQSKTIEGEQVRSVCIRMTMT